MKIITGLSRAITDEEIKAYVDAGIDEFFVGYVPAEWSNKFGYEVSCNRREYARSHYLELDKLEKAVNHIHNNKKKVILAVNAHEYNNTQLKLLVSIIKSIEYLNFDAFIISNIGLMLTLREMGISTPINLSIGGGANNFEAIKFYKNSISNIGRIVLPRLLTMKEIEIIAGKAKEENILLEAFGMAEPCTFNDEYCFNWHGARVPSMCQSAVYENKRVNAITDIKNWKKLISNNDLTTLYKEKYNAEIKIAELKQKHQNKAPKHDLKFNIDFQKQFVINYIIKCGLCAFNKFDQWGIDAIKLPLRGLGVDINSIIIKMVKTVISKQNATPDFCKSLIGNPNFCNGSHCYYNYPYTN